jgi:GDPmannose 4,6-dehydratase
LESITFGVLNLLEAIRFNGNATRLYNASSSECFGDLLGEPADELTPFRPRSPYAVAKAAAFWAVANYREAYGLFACSGLLFNHESPLRPLRFVTRKVVAAACRIAHGSNEQLKLGDLSIARDWGWAPDYVEAMWLMLQQPAPDDYVIATGHTCSLQDFVENSFAQLQLDWRKHVVTDPSLARPNELRISRANPAKARMQLGWNATHLVADVISMMTAAERNSM